MTGIMFLDQDDDVRHDCEKRFEEAGKDLGLEVICWRDVPKKPSALGRTAQATEPVLRQIFMKCINEGEEDSDSPMDRDDEHISQHPKQKDEGGKLEDEDDTKPNKLNRQAFILRKWMTNLFETEPHKPRFYVCSLSSNTIVYKGQLNLETNCAIYDSNPLHKSEV